MYIRMRESRKEDRLRVPDVQQRRLGSLGPLHRADRRPEPKDVRDERGREERFVKHWYSASFLWPLCALRCERRAGPFDAYARLRKYSTKEEGRRDAPVVPQAQGAPEPRDDDIPPAEEGEPVRVVQEEILGFWEQNLDRCVERRCDCYHLASFSFHSPPATLGTGGKRLTTLVPTTFSLPNTQNTS